MGNRIHATAPGLTLARHPVGWRLRPTALGLWLGGLLLSSAIFGVLVPSAFGLISGLVTVLLPVAAWIAWRNLAGLSVGVTERLTTSAGARTSVEFGLETARGGGARDVQLTVLPPGGATPGLVAHVGRLECESLEVVAGRLRWGARSRVQSITLRASSTFPAGLFEMRRTYRLDIDHWVQPRVLRSSRLRAELRSRAGEGNSVSRGRPRGDELHGIEPWRPGMPTSRVVWKLAGRHRELVARRCLGPDLPQVDLSFDPGIRVGSSRGARQTFEFGVVLFASLAASLLAEGTRVSVNVGDGSGPQRMVRGLGDLRRLLRSLTVVEPNSDSSPAELRAGGPLGGERARADRSSLRVHFGRPSAELGQRATEIDASDRSTRLLLPRVAGLLHVDRRDAEGVA